MAELERLVLRAAVAVTVVLGEAVLAGEAVVVVSAEGGVVVVEVVAALLVVVASGVPGPL